MSIQFVKKTVICPKHGAVEVEAPVIPFIGDTPEKVLNSITAASCPKCQQEQEDARIVAEAEFETRRIARLRKTLYESVPVEYRGASLSDFPETERNAKAKRRFEQVRDGELRNLVVVGSRGAGKTMMAIGCMNEYAIRDGLSGRYLYETYDSMVMRFRSVYQGSGETEYGLYRMYADADFLIIDEFGRNKSTDSTSTILFDIVNGRHSNHLPTIIISQLDIDSLRNFMDEAIRSRLMGAGDGVIVGISDIDHRRDSGRYQPSMASRQGGDE
jgi:DNA replication protein